MPRDHLHRIAINGGHDARHGVDEDIAGKMLPGLRRQIRLRLAKQRQPSPLHTLLRSNAKAFDLFVRYDFHFTAHTLYNV